MSTIRRVAQNTVILLGSNLASFVLGFFFTMYVARYLDADGFGILSFGLAFTAIFSVLVNFGLQQLIIREVVRDRALAPKYLGNVAIMKLFLVIPTFGLIALTINLLDYPQQTINVVYLLGLTVVFNSFSLMFYGVFRAFERMEFEALGQVISGALLLGGAFFAISHNFSVLGFSLIYFIASMITLCYSLLISAWKFTLPRLEIDVVFWKKTLKQAWPFGLSLLFVTICFWITPVMLSLMKGDETVGLYNAAYRLTQILLFIPFAYMGAVFPIMSRFFVTSNEYLRYTYERSCKYMLILGVPIAVGTTILAGKIILLIFGIEYYNSIIALQILAWSTVFIFVNAVIGNMLESTNRQTVATVINGSAAVLNIVLNIILIPRYGITGASIAIVTSIFTSFIIINLWSSRIGYGIPIGHLVQIIARVSIASGIMSLLILYLKNFYILALVPMSALLYFAVLYIIGGIDKEDLSLLRSVFARQQ